MKKTRIILCFLLITAMFFSAAILTHADTASYELRDGAAVFNSANNVSYFTKSAEIHNLSISYSPQKNAAEMIVSGDGSDPYALLSYKKLGITNLSASIYKYVVVTYSVPANVSNAAANMELFYCAGSVSVPTAGYSTSFALQKDGTFHTQVIDLSALKGWSGTINALRLDVFMNASVGDVMYVDSVILAKSASEASEIASYRQNKANGLTNDSSHAVVFTNGNYAKYLKADGFEYTVGDLNGDGKINSQDVQILKAYLSGKDITLDREKADVNGDGEISLKDSLALKLCVAGESGAVGGGTTGVASVSFDEKAVLTALNSAPYVTIDYSSETSSLPAGKFNYIVLVYKVDGGAAATASIQALCDGKAASSTSHKFTVNTSGSYVSALIDMSSDASWVGNIDGLRFNFFDSASNGRKMYLDSVILSETSSAANAAASKRIAEANGYTTTSTYKLDISANTLGQINATGTYQNIGPNINGTLMPFTTSWPAAGYPANGGNDTLLTFVNYNNYIKIADVVDLSKYSAVTITYGTDASFTAYSSEFGFFSAPTIYGQKADNSKNTANLQFSVPLTTPVVSGSKSWIGTRSVTKEINSSYVGPLYLSYYMATGDGALITDITFTLKTPAVSADSDTLNNQKGQTVYTVSADGTQITANGKTYPNAINYTSGVTFATDDVNRTLPTDRTGTKVTGYDFANKNVGMFYFLWIGSHGTTGPHNIQKIVETYGVGNVPGNSSVWGPYNYHHWFAEPLYGYYFSSEEWVIRKHVEELTNANVDFIFFDVTNGVPYINVAMKVMSVIHEFNEMGYDAPKVMFYGNDSNGAYTNGQSMMLYLYNQIYARNYFPDTWFYYEGKPVIVGKQAEFSALPAAAQNFFTFRQSQWPTDSKKTNAWSWMDFTDPAVPNKNAATGKNESINVSVAQHMGTIAFGDSGIYGLNITGGSFITSNLNHGRNWHNGKNDTSSGAYKYGYNFQEQWDTVLNKYPDIPVVLVTGWNEWVAGRIDATGTFREASQKNMAWFVDTATVDFSRDVEMTRGYYFDNYYMQLISNIRKYKGSSPTLVQNMMKRIDVTGSFDQWNDVTVSYRDATGDTMNRNTTTFGGTSYVNTTGRNDIKSAKVVYDTEYIYFYAECVNNISSYNTTSSWMQLFIDADSSASTGWYGYDYIVNYAPSSSTKTSIAHCTTKGSYSFSVTNSDISYSVYGNMIMIRVPLSALGISDYNKINISFKWADSTSKITTMEQMYTDGDTMPHGRLNYVFTNVK